MKIKKINKIMLLSGVLFTIAPLQTSALTKYETVYSKLNYDGTVMNTIVNNKIHNNEGLDTIEDYTTLKDVLNLSNDYAYKRIDNKITWNSYGKDVYYQGYIKNELPVQLKISYYLNDTEMKLEDMIGKNGHIKMVLKYTNTDKHKVKVNGKNEVLYTPFMVTMGTILDDTYTTNISISNGKVINNGTKSIIVGVAMPGLYESLKNDNLKGMDTITLEFDTTKFELASIYSMVMPKVITSEDLSFLDNINDIYGKVNALQSGINKIQDGIEELSKNGDTINDGVKQISDNLNLVSKKFKDIKDGSISLYDGVTEILSELEKADSLITGGDSNSDKIKELQNGNKTAIAQLENANLYLQQSVSAIDPSINLDTIDLSLITDPTLLQTLTQVKTQYDANNKLIYLLNQNQTYINTSSSLLSYAQTQISPLVSELKEGLLLLKSGTKQLTSGTESMEEALITLANKSVELKNGVSKYNTGVKSLETGIVTFNRTGISKITNLVNNDLKSNTKKVEALVKLGEDYKTLSGTNDNTDGETKFVLVVDGKKAPKEEAKTKEQPKVTLWQRFKNLFK